MTKSTITREQLIKKAQEQIEFCRHTKITGEGRAHVNQCAALFEIALAAMDSEPVAWGNGCDKTVPAALRFLAENERPFGGESRFNAAHLYQLAREIELMAEAPLYRHAQPVTERDQVRIAHAEWSQATFGNVGPVGPLKHLSKEALEAAAEPGDLSEWADMQFLLWDAQRRAGITDEQITQAMIDKLAVNKQRSWPEPKDGEPRLHINEQPALTGNSPIIGIDLASAPDRTVEVRYVAPPGYVMVPKEPTREMLDEFDSIIDYGAEDSQDAWRRLLAATPQEVKGE